MGPGIGSTARYHKLRIDEDPLERGQLTARSRIDLANSHSAARTRLGVAVANHVRACAHPTAAAFVFLKDGNRSSLPLLEERSNQLGRTTETVPSRFGKWQRNPGAQQLHTVLRFRASEDLRPRWNPKVSRFKYFCPAKAANSMASPAVAFL